MMDPEVIELVPLEAAPPPDFRCSRKEQNEFLQERAWDEQQLGLSVTYLALLNGIVVGYLTVSMDALPLQTSEKPASHLTIVRFPAIKLAQLATRDGWENRGIGRHLIALAAGMGLELRGKLGCRYLTLDAKRDRLDWYKRQEFKVNKIARREQEERAKERGIALDELPVSMRLDLFSLLEDLQDAYPADFPRT